MISINGLLTAPKEQIKFVSDYIQEFRNHVRSEMQRLGIQMYEEYIYENCNHYVSNNKRELEQLRISLLSEMIS